MTDNEIRIKIAEALGYTPPFKTEECRTENHATEGWVTVLTDANDRYVPDYLNDLNACAKFENVLGTIGAKEYGKRLQEVTGWHCVGIVPDYERDLVYLSRVARATARQRCEAFLRTMNLWEDK